ncbi:hypothetical protein ACFLSA_05715, partial [Bacteroidota bacterium]
MKRNALSPTFSLLLIFLFLAFGCQKLPDSGQGSGESLDIENESRWLSSVMQLPSTGAPGRGGEPLVACYRKDFVLPAAPRHAKASFYIVSSLFWDNGEYLESNFINALDGEQNIPCWISVNDKMLVEPVKGGIQVPGIKNLDLTSVLKKGHNVITFSRECSDANESKVVVEGIVFCDNGATIRILTEHWKGGWNLGSDWQKPDAMPRQLQPVATTGEPLSGPPDQVYRHPYYGPIHVQPVIYPTGEPMGQPIFDEENPVSLDIMVLNRQKEGLTGAGLWVEIENKTENKAMGRHEIALKPEGSLDLFGKLDLGKLPAGVYQLAFTFQKDGNEVDSREYEIVSVGRIEQRLVQGTHYEDGLNLEKVWEIDCTTEPDKEDFVASHTNWGQPGETWKEIETEVTEGPAGRYRVLVENGGSYYFAYKYRINTLYEPHLAVVEWPDDANRNFIIHIKEPGSGYPSGEKYDRYRNAGFQRSEAGLVMDHDRFPARSNKMQKLHLLFWPNSKEGSIHICNIGGAENPSAAAKIAFYHIKNDLPALDIKDAGDRLIGPHTERGGESTASSYYSGKYGSYFTTNLGLVDHSDFYANWYVTTQNLIKRMRFSGQNLYLMGHFMYNSTLYPSELREYGYSQNTYRGGDVVRDNVGLILRMFERNGISMISGVEHFTIDALAKVQPTPEEIRKGVDHQFMVTREGTLFPVHAVRYASGGWTGSGQPLPDGSMRWPAPNYFHPVIQERFMAIVDDLADLYQDYTAWKGIAFFLSRVMGPMEVAHLRSKALLEAGYEDYTIDLFEKETGIHIPVNKRDPDRFEKRYQWIKKTIEEEWINWRCSKYTDFLKRIRDRVSGRRQDVKLYIITGEPMLWQGSQEILDGHYNDSAYIVNLFKKFGFDLPELKKEQGIVFTPMYPLAGSAAALYSGDHEGWFERNRSQMWHSLLANDGIGGAFLKANIPHYGAYTLPEGRWLFQSSGTRQGWFWSTYVTESFVNVMARSNPTWMPHTWMDICESMGRIQEKRTFARSYRSLPNAKYERLTGNGLDRNIWISVTQTEDVQYAYAANLNWWKTNVSLQFSEGTKVHDLIRDEELNLNGGPTKLELPPYFIHTFRIIGGKFVSADASIQESDREYIENEISTALEKANKVATEARKREKEFAGKPGWESLTELEERIELAENRFEMGDLAGAYTLIHGA